jgi:hypothetical protein
MFSKLVQVLWSISNRMQIQRYERSFMLSIVSGITYPFLGSQNYDYAD